MHVLAPGPTHWRRSAGDQIGHLWWRLLNGELPAVNPPGAVVVLIGARHAPHAAASVAAALAALLRYMAGNGTSRTNKHPASANDSMRWHWPCVSGAGHDHH